MIQININTIDGQVHEFGQVNLKTIYNKIESVDVLNDNKSIHSYKFKSGENPLLRRRTNSEEGVVFFVGFHKNGKQKLTIIKEDGEIIKDKDRTGHIFHSDLSIEEHEI